MIATDGEVSFSLSPDGMVGTLLLDREAKLNTLTIPLLERLEQLCDDAERSSARVVVLRTAGTRAFCVGADIARFAELDPVAMWSVWIGTGHRAFERLARLRQPTIAVIDGPALGGGLELALACDFRVVAATARLGLPEAGLGTVPGWGGTTRLVHAIGRARASELMLTRRQITGEEALSWGLATRVAPVDSLDVVAAALVEEVLGSAPLAAQIIKQLIRAGGDESASRILEGFAGGLAATTSDLREGVAAFRDKRPPHFTGA
jgi:enoyl-CoA hydratase